MNEDILPKGWMWTSLGEVVSRISNGITQRQEKEIIGIPVTRIETISNGTIDLKRVGYLKDLRPEEIEKYKLLPGDILFSHINSDLHLGKTAIFYFDSLTLLHGTNLLLIRPYKGLISPELLHYLCNYYRFSGTFISIAQHAVNQSSINQSKLRKLKIPVPPLAEQRRIIAKLEELFTRLDAGVKALKKAEAQLKRYRQAVFKSACGGRLVPTEAELARTEGRVYEPADVLLTRILKERHEKWERSKGGKYKEPTAPETNGLPELPEGWCWAALPQLGNLARGKSKHRPRDDKQLFGGPYPFIQTGDVKNSNGIIKKFSQTYSEFGLAQSRLWPKGTLCITIAANIADSGILNFPSCFPDSIVGFICEDVHCDVRFIEFFIRTAKKDLEKYAPATAQKNINLDILVKLAVFLPPLAEQRRIVAEVERCFSVADEVEKAVELGLRQAERLRQSILKRAFEGKLVSQDPSDEPASVLLERIKAEKAMQEDEKNAKKKSKRKNDKRQKKIIFFEEEIRLKRG